VDRREHVGKRALLSGGRTDHFWLVQNASGCNAQIITTGETGTAPNLRLTEALLFIAVG